MATHDTPDGWGFGTVLAQQDWGADPGPLVARPGWLCGVMRPDALGNLSTAGILCQLEVVVGLKVGPKLRRRSKVARQTERGVCRNRSFAPNNVIHPCHWHH